MINFVDEELKNCFDYARNMIDKHNINVIKDRENWEIFNDDFKVKVAELAFRKVLAENNIYSDNDISYECKRDAKWDIFNVKINDKLINIKFVDKDDEFLLLDMDNYESDGAYDYDDEPLNFYGYAIVRVIVEPNILPEVLKYKVYSEFKNNVMDYKQGKEVERTIEANFLGVIKQDDFWKNKGIAPNGIRVSNKNFEAVLEGKNKDEMPEVLYGCESKEEVLQKDVYVLPIDKYLQDVNILK